jgi:hypothetical protein
MGASSMASGRNPSMLRMITRRIARCGVGVLVIDSAGRKVSVGKRVSVSVDVRSAFVAVTGTAIGPDNLQANKNSKSKVRKAGQRFVLIMLILMEN